MKKLGNWFCTLCFILLVTSACLAGVQIARLQMLGLKYLVPLLAAAGVVVLLLGFWMLPRVGKKNRKAAGRVAACLLAVVLSAGFLFGTAAVGKVHETMDAVTTTQTAHTVVQVFVKKDNEAALDSGSIFGWTAAFDAEQTQRALEALEQEAGCALQLQPFDSVPELVDALYADEVDAVVLSSAYLGILENMEQYADFQDRTTILHDLKVEKPVQEETLPAEEPEQPAETEPEKEKSEHAFLIYLSGVDTRAQGPTAGLSDVNILAAVNPDTRQAILINTPRDYYIPNPASGTGALDKLTHCGAYGVENSIRALSALYDQPIDYAARINFTGFEKLIDAMGGVTVQSEYEFNSKGYHFNVGPNEVHGRQALVFARTRYVFPNQDQQRGRHQMNLIKAIVEKATTSTTLITNYAQIMESLQGMFTTTVPKEKIQELVRMQLDDPAPWTIYSYAVNGSDDRQLTYSTGKDFIAYVMQPNLPAVEQAHDLMDCIFYGDPITAKMLVPPQAPVLETEESEQE